MDADAILDAIRNVVKGAAGSVRTVPAGTFGEDVHEDIPDGARWLRAKVKKQFDVSLRPPRRTSAVGPVNGSRALLELWIDVRLTYAADAVEDLIEERRYAVRALAADDALAVTQALTWPGNVAGLVSSKLRQREAPVVAREDWSAGIYEVELRFDAWVNETQAVA